MKAIRTMAWPALLRLSQARRLWAACGRDRLVPRASDRSMGGALGWCDTPPRCAAVWQGSPLPNGPHFSGRLRPMDAPPDPRPAMLRVMLVDDHEVVRRGLRALVDGEADMVVVAEAATLADAVRLARQAEPDVVVMDVRLPDGSGIEAVREIRSHRRRTRALRLTTYADENAVRAAILAGASGYLLKEVNGDEILAGIRALGDDKSLLDPAVTTAVLERIRSGNRSQQA